MSWHYGATPLPPPFQRSFNKLLAQKEELEQKHLHLLQIVESEKTAKWQYTRQCEELTDEIKQLRTEVRMLYGWCIVLLICQSFILSFSLFRFYFGIFFVTKMKKKKKKKEWLSNQTIVCACDWCTSWWGSDSHSSFLFVAFFYLAPIFCLNRMGPGLGTT